MRQYSDEVQSSSAKQLDEMQRNFNNEQLELNQRLSEALNNIESLRSDKQRYEYAYYDLENRYQQLEQLLKDKDMELSINSCFVS
jgi:chromosome segregation ATPase